jgi:hypothetical protein
LLFVIIIKETARSKEMQPAIWKPPIELSKQEEQIVGRIRRAKLFVFLRQHRHEVFDESFQAALDRDWDQQIQKDEALTLVLNVLQAVEAWVQTLQQEDTKLVEPSLEVARQVKEQGCTSR